jgi:hypothetical protein
MFHVAHGDRITATQFQHDLFESSPPGQSSQFVAVRYFIAMLEHRVDQDQPRGAEVKE